MWMKSCNCKAIKSRISKQSRSNLGTTQCHFETREPCDMQEQNSVVIFPRCSRSLTSYHHHHHHCHTILLHGLDAHTIQSVPKCRIVHANIHVPKSRPCQHPCPLNLVHANIHVP